MFILRYYISTCLSCLFLVGGGLFGLVGCSSQFFGNNFNTAITVEYVCLYLTDNIGKYTSDRLCDPGLTPSIRGRGKGHSSVVITLSLGAKCDIHFV